MTEPVEIGCGRCRRRMPHTFAQSLWVLRREDWPEMADKLATRRKDLCPACYEIVLDYWNHLADSSEHL